MNTNATIPINASDQQMALVMSIVVSPSHHFFHSFYFYRRFWR